MKRNGKRISASLLAMIMVISMVVPMITVPVAALPVPSGTNGIYWLDPDDSSAPYCQNATVDVWINSSIPFFGGTFRIETDPDTCGEFVVGSDGKPIINANNTVFNYGHAVLPDSDKHVLRVRYQTVGSIEVAPGAYHIGNFSIHCNSTAACVTDLEFISDVPNTYITNGTGDKDTVEDNGTFTCEAEEAAIDVDIRANSITGNIFAVSGYTINPGTVTKGTITIDNQTAMGAMVVYCQDNGINVSLIMHTTLGEYVIQIGDNASDNNSWMYAVNETSPWVGGAQYGLSGGEKVHWFNYNIPYYQVLTTLNTTSIKSGDYLMATVTWENTTGTYLLNGATVYETATAYTPGTSVGTTGPDGNCTFQADETGIWYVYAEYPTYGSGIYNYPAPYYDCWLPKPDLVITEKSEEWVDLANKAYNVTYTVCNLGEGDAGASNTTITIDGVDGVDVLEDPVPALAAGENYTNTIGPFTMSGDSDTIMVCADGNDAVAESNKTNNCLENVFTYQGMPDLVITGKSEEWISLKDKTYNVTYTVKNNGTAAVGASTTSIKIDGTEQATDSVPALVAGASYTGTVGPFTMSGNNDTIKVCADKDNVVSESNEDNNCLENEFWYQGMPDLVITDIWTEVIKVGKKFNTTIIYYSITNTGGAEAGRSVSNLTVDGNVTKKRDGVKPLAVGETRPEEFFRYRSATPPNTIKVCADYNNRIAESNETNNCREEPYL